MQTTEVMIETARWLRYAGEDLITAETLLAQARIPPRQACWHAQQAAEKALKAVLIFLQIDFPRTHDLNVLRNLALNRLGNRCPLPGEGTRTYESRGNHSC